MFRWLAVCLVLCLATISLMSLALGVNPLRVKGKEITEVIIDPTKDSNPSNPANFVIIKPSTSDSDSVLVVYDAHVRAMDIQNVPSEREGRIVFIGTEYGSSLEDGSNLPKGKELEKLIQEGKIIKHSLDYMVTQINPNEKNLSLSENVYTFPDRPDQRFRIWKKGDRLQPGRHDVAMIEGYYRKLERGQKVNQGDLVALINPEIALHDLRNKINSFAKAEAERVASEKTRDETEKRYEAMTMARKITKAVSDTDYREAKLNWDRYIYEEIAKKRAVDQAASELDAANAILRMHEVRAQISGKITTIYKYRGDAVKTMEPVLQIQNEDNLRVEGSINIADALLLSEGMPVSIEPSHPESGITLPPGHTREIKCLAVTNGPKVRIISGGEDRSLRVWDPIRGQALNIISSQTSSPHAVATATFPDQSTRALVGWSDGTLQLLNVDAIGIEEPFKVLQAHKNGVNSVAINADASLALSTGDDRSIKVWKILKVDNGYELQPLPGIKDAHSSSISCVQFIRSSDTNVNEFYSVGHSSLRIWRMENDQQPIKKSEFDNRSGALAILGNDGKRVLFDEGGELRLRSLSDATLVEGKLRNPPGSSPFTNMALFAPNGKTILTNVAADGRLQLWRTPLSQGRGSELRQFVSTNGNTNNGGAVCGAFAPDSSFIVTAHDQNLMLWKMPSDQEIGAHLKGHLIRVGTSKESSSSPQVPIWAVLDDSPPLWFTPGTQATMVIQKKSSGLGQSKP